MKRQLQTQRNVLKQSLRVGSLMSADDHVALFDLALADDVVFEILYQQTMERVEEFGQANSLMGTKRSGDDEVVVQSTIGLLAWLSQNRTTLIEDLETIVKLLGGIEIASSVVGALEPCADCPATSCVECRGAW